MIFVLTFILSSLSLFFYFPLNYIYNYKDWDHKVDVAKTVPIPHDDNRMEVADDGPSELFIEVPNVTEVDNTVDNTEDDVEEPYYEPYYGSDNEIIVLAEPSDEEEGTTSQPPVLATNTSTPLPSRSLSEADVPHDTATVLPTTTSTSQPVMIGNTPSRSQNHLLQPLLVNLVAYLVAYLVVVHQNYLL